METEKQIIEEMAVTIANFRIQICKAGNCKTCTSRIDTNKECYFVKQAKVLYKSGYRKEKQGKWQIRKSKVEADLFCSNCGYQYTEAEPSQIELYNYCPHCGAHMKEVE